MAEEEQLINCVCTANICRSPMAERLIAHALKGLEEPLNGLKTVSTGIAAMDGSGPSPNSVTALRKVGIDLADHRSQPITEDIVKSSVLTLCMTESHRYFVEESYPERGGPVLLMRELLPHPADPQIPDPFGQNLAAYEACRDSMVEAIPSILKYLRGNRLKAP